jgi:fibronectin-binding autotransporter adhesin
MSLRRFRPLASAARPVCRRARLVLEALEDRCVPAVLTVTNPLDDGSGGTLRELVASATPGDTIDFAPELTGQTIIFGLGEIVIDRDLTIQGPGADQLVLSGNGQSRVFSVDGPGTLSVTLSGLTLSAGSGTSAPTADAASGTAADVGGGAIRNADENLTLAGTILSDNHTTGPGGAVLSQGGSLTLQNSTVRDNTSDADGGAVAVTGGSILVEGTTLSGNSAAGRGGALATSGASVIVRDSTVAGNTATTLGGGLSLAGAGTVTVERTTIRDNTATTRGGGGIHLAVGGEVILRDSTLSGNRAGDGTGDNGGGILVESAGGPVTLIDSTLSGNTATGAGGGLSLQQASGSFRVLNSTITLNQATEAGGGLRVSAGATLTLLESTIVAGNTANSTGPDVSSAGTIASAQNNLVENAIAGNQPAAQSGNLFGVSARLGPLQDNGGPTSTHALLTGSPARDAGSNPDGVQSDQRGTGFDRVGNERADIGAVESDTVVPTASLADAPDVTTLGDTTYEFQVAFSDNRAVRFDSLADSNLRVTGPDGFSQLATLVSVEETGNGSPLTATYRFTPPGGTWDSSDNGDYTVSVEANQVFDIDGNAVAAGDLGKFSVQATTPLPPTGRFAISGNALGSPRVQVFENGSTTPALVLEPTTLKLPNGARVATGDVTGDGIEDIVVAGGPGGEPRVKVFDGETFAEVRNFLAYDSSFVGGVNVAVGDVNGDGQSDIITGADAGGWPHVKVFSGKDGAELYSFMVFDQGFVGGVRVAAGDVNGDGRADIIAAAGAGASPHVRVFSGLDLSELASFFAYDTDYSGGVVVAAGDLDGDGRAEVITGAGMGSHVKAFDIPELTLMASFFAFGAGFDAPIHVGVEDANNDGRPDLLVLAGAPSLPHLQAFDGLTLTSLDRAYALSTPFLADSIG